MKTNSPPETKSAEQESFMKAKKKVIGKEKVHIY